MENKDTIQKEITEKILKEDLGICERCKKNKATLVFAEGVLAYTHGFTENICQECYNKMQKEHPLYKRGFKDGKSQAIADKDKEIKEANAMLNRRQEHINYLNEQLSSQRKEFEGMIKEVLKEEIISHKKIGKEAIIKEFKIGSEYSIQAIKDFSEELLQKLQEMGKEESGFE